MVYIRVMEEEQRRKRVGYIPYLKAIKFAGGLN